MQYTSSISILFPPHPATASLASALCELTHPQAIDPSHQCLVLDGDFIREVLVEAWLQRNEFGQRGKVVYFLCKREE